MESDSWSSFASGPGRFVKEDVVIAVGDLLADNEAITFEAVADRARIAVAEIRAWEPLSLFVEHAIDRVPIDKRFPHVESIEVRVEDRAREAPETYAFPLIPGIDFRGFPCHKWNCTHGGASFGPELLFMLTRGISMQSFASGCIGWKDAYTTCSITFQFQMSLRRANGSPD